MILSEALDGLTAYLSAALDDCGRAVCAAYRYHGLAEPVPGGPGGCDCVCDETSDMAEQLVGFPQGVLRVTWRLIGPSEKPPTMTTTTGVSGVKPVVEVVARVMRCWPTEKASVAEMDAAAAGLADDAWCLVCAGQTAVACANPRARSEIGLGMCGGIYGYRVASVDPQGGCAGTQLTLSMALAGSCV